MFYYMVTTTYVLCCIFDNTFLRVFFCWYKCFAWVDILQPIMNKATRGSAVTKLYKHYTVYFPPPFQMGFFPTLWNLLSVFLDTRQEKLDSDLWPTQLFLTAVNEDIYWSFIMFSWHCHGFWRCHIVSRCRLPSLWSGPPTHLKLSAFSQTLGDNNKEHMQTSNHRLALGLLQREKPTLPQLNLF